MSNVRRTKNHIIRIALEYAILYEESFLDAMRGCKEPSDLQAISYAKRNIEDFKKLLVKLTAN